MRFIFLLENFKAVLDISFIISLMAIAYIEILIYA